MEHNPIQTMLHEHEVISQAEDVVENCKGLWLTDTDRYKEISKVLVVFFREYADGYHHRKEEEVLFPALHDNPDFVLHEILEEFETHHDDFRDYTKEFETAIEEEDYEGSHTIISKYLQDLLDHIGAENDELFVLAENLLSEDEQETIYFKFKDIDLELGEERKAELEHCITAIMV